MDDLIPRAAARDVINTWGRKENEDVRMDLLHNDLNAIPAVDAVPVMHGWWYDKDSLSCRCSCCGCKSNKEYNYCPNCGVKMDGERRDDDGADA